MKYVVNMLAKPNTITTSQMTGLKVEEAMASYLKNATVSLTSFGLHNPSFQPILFVNFDLDKNWEEVFSKERIKVIYLPFGEFSISDNFSWSIVQYRYDVLKYMSENFNADDIIVQLDTDVVCTGNLDEMVEELENSENSLLLYDVQHSCSNRDRKNIIDNYEKIYNRRDYMIHYGGEFIGGKVSNIKKLFELSKQVINDSNVSSNLVNFNDEHITSIAAYKSNMKIHNANAYIFRYWTGKFYLVSTNYKNNKVMLWHVPSEKNTGMIYLYNYYCKKHKYPKDEKIASLFGFAPCKSKFAFVRSVIIFKYKVSKFVKKVKSKF